MTTHELDAHMRGLPPRAATGPDYYDCDAYTDRLTHQDESDAIEYALDAWLTPKMTAAEVIATLPKTLTVYEFSRMEVEADVDSLAYSAIERAFEALEEEYGDPESEGDVTQGMRDAALAFAQVMVAEYSPWACEQTGQHEVDVETWIRENRPDWLEDKP
jgi:hypothetical protein